MARIQRVSSKQSIKTMAVNRVKQLLILMLTVIVGVLLSVSVNAQKNTVKHTEKKKTKVYKIKNRAKANHYANACEILNQKRTSLTNQPVRSSRKETVSRKASGAVAQERAVEAGFAGRSIIREMVALYLSETEDSTPIELAPLLFSRRADKLSVSDVNPFLIAVEFALQGKTIVLENQIINHNGLIAKTSTFLIDEITGLMREMGVPNDRIAVHAGEPVAAAVAVTPDNFAVPIKVL